MLIDLAAYDACQHDGLVPVNHTTQVIDGREYTEPILDFNDLLGVPQDFGIDIEVPDPTAADIQSLDRRELVYNVSPSEFAETAIVIAEKGKQHPFSFDERPYLKRIYDTGAKRRLLVCGRQTEKSTSLGNIMICYSCLNSHFRSLYVSPSAEQSKTFSNDRVSEVITLSQMVKAYTTTTLTNAVFHKKFINYSQIRMRYAYLNADRVRGIPADLITVDELQDIIVDHLPVIEECASHSPYKIFLYSGTPKTLDNTIEHYHQNFSTQNEWVVPCRRHGTPNDKSSWYWNILDEHNIGREGVICSKCKEPIAPDDPDACWAALNPITANNADKVTFEGYRIPQLMVPWVFKNAEGWAELWAKYQRYERHRLFNEVLGLSYDSGTKPITTGQLQAICRPEIHLSDYEFHRGATRNVDVFAGIDWGTAESTYSVISLGAYMGTGNFTIFWIHRFVAEEADPTYQLDLIDTIISQFNVRIIGADYGGGFDRNDHLVRAFGPQRVAKYQYTANQRKAKIYWEPALGRYMVHRSETMTDIFSMMVRKQLDLPNWSEFEDPYGKDILNIFSEYNDRLRMTQYSHAVGATDDSFHSILYCILASMIKYPRPDILRPLQDNGQDYIVRPR